MTCFWDGILSSLDAEDYRIIGCCRDAMSLIGRLKVLAPGSPLRVKWQGSEISPRDRRDVAEAVKNYNADGISAGHLTSSFDAFLCLMTDLLKCRIHFNYMGHPIIFEHTDEIRKTFKFVASASHFQRI